MVIYLHASIQDKIMLQVTTKTSHPSTKEVTSNERIAVSPVTVTWRGKRVFPGINKTKGVCGGSARVGNTRIPVWLIISLREEGASIQKILKFYPHLFASDIASAENYYLYNKSEIDKEILKNHRED